MSHLQLANRKRSCPTDKEEDELMAFITSSVGPAASTPKRKTVYDFPDQSDEENELANPVSCFWLFNFVRESSHTFSVPTIAFKHKFAGHENTKWTAKEVGKQTKEWNSLDRNQPNRSLHTTTGNCQNVISPFCRFITPFSKPKSRPEHTSL